MGTRVDGLSQRIRGVGLALVPAQMRSVHEYMGSAGRSVSARLGAPVLAHTWLSASLDARCASRLRILSATFTSSFTSKTEQSIKETLEEVSPLTRESLT